MHVKTGDTVVVIAGNDKGKVGEIQAVDLAKERVIVEGVNVRTKHQKPTQQNPKGERAEVACSIHVSNVMHWDAQAKKGVRKRPESN